jgi:hypothetical protein
VSFSFLSALSGLVENFGVMCDIHMYVRPGDVRKGSKTCFDCFGVIEEFSGEYAIWG